LEKSLAIYGAGSDTRTTRNAPRRPALGPRAAASVCTVPGVIADMGNRRQLLSVAVSNQEDSAPAGPTDGG